MYFLAGNYKTHFQQWNLRFVFWNFTPVFRLGQIPFRKHKPDVIGARLQTVR